MYKYISNQDVILKHITQDILSEKKFAIIKGTSGTGKSFLLNCVETQQEGITFTYKLEGDYYLRSRDFYPFLNFINSMYLHDKKNIRNTIVREGIKNTIGELGSLSPLGDDLLSVCITELSNVGRKKRELYNSIFCKEELDVLFPLEYFCSKEKQVIFLIDDLQYWDSKSLRLLYTLMKMQNNEYVFLKNAQFVGVINTDFHNYDDELNGIITLADQCVYKMDVTSKENYKTVLKQLGLDITLSNELIEALYSISGGNLQLTADIVLLLNDEKNIDETVRKIISDKNLGHLLIERLSKINDKGNMINETLKYASLFGSSFYYHDLEQVLEKDESYIRNLIEAAQEFCLVYKSANGASFIHELIREAYKIETQENKVKYYTGYANCLKILYPGKYKERAESLRDAGEYESAAIISILDFLKQLRTNKTNCLDSYTHLELPYYLKDFMESMEKAYNFFFGGAYDKCLFVLDSIDDIFPSVLQAEKYYLVSITLSKWLDTSSRKRAFKCLEPFLNIAYIDNEIEVWERIVSAYIIACVHNNACEEAKKYEIQLKESIGKRIAFDIDASYKINIMRRKASSLHNPEQSFISTEKSKNFFAPKIKGGLPLDPIEYYMSLNNFLATSLMAGEFETTLNEATEILSLPKKIKYLKFPRFEMPINNAILIYYLNNQITADKACERLQQVIDTYNLESSTEVIIRVNIAIFHAISNNLSKSLNILKNLFDKMKEIDNLEFYYKYLVEVNFKVIEYLNGDKSSLNTLSKLQKECVSQGEKYLEAHVKSLVDLSTQTLPIDTSWYITPLTDFKLEHSNCWKYYGRKYLFGELEFWSES